MKRVLIALSAAALVGISDVAHAVAAPTTVRVSVTNGGGQADGELADADVAVSQNGRYVVFASTATNLVAGDSNGVSDVFLRDLVSGTTERVSVSSAEAQGNAGSFGPVAISGDGRFVVFATWATNLAAASVDFMGNTVIRDRTVGTTAEVRSWVEDWGPGSNVAVSDDGQYVALEDVAKDFTYVVRLNRANGVARVVVNPLQTDWSSESLGGMSADGSRVFVSVIGGYVRPPYGLRWGLFVHDFPTRRSLRVDLNNGQQPENRFGRADALSADGRYVLFSSPATNLIAGDTNGAWDVFVRNVDTRRTGRTSISDRERQANAGSRGLGISGGGRYRLFTSVASNLVPGDLGARDVFVRDRYTGQTRRCSVTDAGLQADGSSGVGSLSRNGLWAVFRSAATNLVPGDTNGFADWFARGQGC